MTLALLSIFKLGRLVAKVFCVVLVELFVQRLVGGRSSSLSRGLLYVGLRGGEGVFGFLGG